MKEKFFFLVFFAILLASSRLIPHPPNFTPIIASALLAPLLIKDRIFGICIPLLAMFFSDIIIGFHPYQFVVYSTLLIISLLAPMKKNFIYIGAGAILSSVWFFVVTNFSVWIIWDFYPKTLEGLLLCYTLAIPFFKNTLISTILFTGILFISSKYLSIASKKIDFFIFKKSNVQS